MTLTDRVLNFRELDKNLIVVNFQWGHKGSRLLRYNQTYPDYYGRSKWFLKDFPPHTTFYLRDLAEEYVVINTKWKDFKNNINARKEEQVLMLKHLGFISNNF